LKPGGWFVAAVPLIDSLQASLFGRRWAHVTEAPRHVTLPASRALRYTGRKVGFGRIIYRSDSLQTCAASLALTLVPGSTTKSVYDTARLSTLATRVMGASVAVLSVPWCWFENAVLKRPALGVIFMQKPVDGDNKTS